MTENAVTVPETPQTDLAASAIAAPNIAENAVPQARDAIESAPADAPRVAKRMFRIGEVTLHDDGVTIEGGDAGGPIDQRGNYIVSGGGRDELYAWIQRHRRGLWRCFYGPLGALLSYMGLRFVLVSFPDRIGHLAVEPDLFLRQRKMGHYKGLLPIMLLRRDLAANGALLDHWARAMRVWQGKWTWRLLSPLLLHEKLCLYVGDSVIALKQSASLYDTYREWGDRGPVARLDPKLREKGWAWLESLGVPRDAWFACVHAREPGYSPKDEHIHRYRNASIDKYRLAMKAINARGGYAIRIGDASMKPLGDVGGRVIDYATMEGKEEWMDLFLAAECRFLLGNTSGPFQLAKMFDKPCVLANMVPYGTALGPTPKDLSIPKLLKDRNGVILPFEFIFRSHASRMRCSHDYRENFIAVRQNEPEDIADVTVEMMDRLDGRFETNDYDAELQATFRSFFQPGDYAHGAPGKIGRDFLRKYRDLC